MSTKLELAQQLSQEVDLAGEGPSSTVGQTGENRNLSNWINRAYKDIENRTLWRWMRRTATVETTASDDTYAYTDFTDTTDAAAISRFKQWRLNDRRDPPKIYTTASGVGNERWLVFVSWDNFKNIYKRGTQNDGAPAHITLDPNDNIVIGPSPNDVYTITVDYHMSPQDLLLDADIPEMPSHFHDLIVYYAMRKYAYQQLAPEVLEWATSEQRRLLRRLENEQLPRMRKSGPMA